MASLDRFQVVLLPRREVLVSDLPLREAVAYLAGYNEVMPPSRQQVVIAPMPARGASASARSLRRPSPAAKAERPAEVVRSA